MRATLMVLAALTLGACGSDGTDISGMYMVTSMTQDTGCGPGTAPATVPPFMLAKKQSLLGQDYYDVATCTANDKTMCTGYLGSLLAESIPDGWKGPISASSGTPASCGLTYIEVTAVLKDGTLRVEKKQYGAQNLMVSKCDPDEATKRGATMPCTGYTLVTGTAIK